MKKLFISQPMNGKTDEEILAERNRAIDYASKMIKDEVTVIDSFLKKHQSEQSHCGFLGSRSNFFQTLM